MTKPKHKPISTQHTADGIALIRIDCPPAIFDTEGAYIMRRKRIAIWKLDTIKGSQPGQEEEVYRIFADLIPEWHGVPDVETGEPLPNLADDPQALIRLDTEQLTWLTQILSAKPGELGNPTKRSLNGQT